jgi:hypothetical protein
VAVFGLLPSMSISLNKLLCNQENRPTEAPAFHTFRRVT